MPASTQLVLLRIVDPAGNTRKTCAGPAPVGTALAEAQAGFDWWFTATARPLSGGDDGTPVAVSQFVYINHARGTCEAGPGETYSADYLGRVPDAGCQATADCDAALGTPGAWRCCATVDDAGACVAPKAGAAAPGTCLCTGK